MLKHRWRTLLAMSFFGAAILSGCGDDDNGNGIVTDAGVDAGDAATDAATDAGDAGNGDTARVRAIHLSPDAPGVDIFVNEGTTPSVTNLAFPDTTEYLTVPAGSYDFAVSATGTPAADAVLNIDDLTLEAGQSYTAVAYGTLDDTDETELAALPLVDDYEGLAEGAIRVRAIHTAVGVGEVDILAVTEEGNAPLIEDLEYGEASDALDVPAAEYTIGIDTDDDGTPEYVFSLPNLDAGAVVNIFAVQQGGEVFLIAQLPEGDTVRIDPDTAE